MTASVESRVGLFFLVGLIILGVVTFKVEDLSGVLKKKTIMKIRVKHAAGLKVGDTVALAGLKVGEIKSIEILRNTVEVTMGIEKAVAIKEDSVARIAWGGLLGNRYIDISFGSPEAPVLPPGSFIKSEEAIRLDKIFDKVEVAATDFQNILTKNKLGPKLTKVLNNAAQITDDIVAGKGTIGKLVKDPQLYDNLKSASAQIKSGEGTIGKLIYTDELHKKALAVVEDLKSASARVEKLLADNDERIQNVIKSLEAAGPEAKEAFAAIRELGKKVDSGEGVLAALINDKEMRKNAENALSRLSASLDKIDEFTKNLKEGKGLAAKLINDEEFAQTIETAGEDLKQAAESLRTVAERIQKGDNTVARLTRDSDMYDDIKKLLADARETLRRVREQVPVGTFAGVLLSAF